MSDKKRTYLYGPVPSRRLGRSYGVDIIPFKVCTLDCVYCQLGKTITKTTERKDYVPIDAVLAELREALSEKVASDYITIAGSGEPTLHAQLGRLIDGIKELIHIPIALLTNGTLLYRPDVRADCVKADVVMPSLDAADDRTFQRINRPHPDINAKNAIFGLSELRKEYTGQIWLEIFFIDDINTGEQQIHRIKEAIHRIRPDKIHLNTAVRPTAEPHIHRVDVTQLQSIASYLGANCEVIADIPKSQDETFSSEPKEMFEPHQITATKTSALLSMLKRRPCSLNDICAGLGMAHNEALKHIHALQERGLIHTERKGERLFFKSSS